ncbi:hypothetical protein QET93_002395 [Akkermansia sp. N21116]|uniref:hypothetical protein n=1 Tax=Akkermansia sp. N21116 TaxID=3040764 RepID=UPI00244ED519|nr:hypothetical protein [Akkermansia sp. N21116]WPX40954.1 hypothetical protein QET93_002395 [Akkermansia sp. N21116]
MDGHGKLYSAIAGGILVMLLGVAYYRIEHAPIEDKINMESISLDHYFHGTNLGEKWRVFMNGYYPVRGIILSRVIPSKNSGNPLSQKKYVAFIDETSPYPSCRDLFETPWIDCYEMKEEKNMGIISIKIDNSFYISVDTMMYLPPYLWSLIGYGR